MTLLANTTFQSRDKVTLNGNISGAYQLTLEAEAINQIGYLLAGNNSGLTGGDFLHAYRQRLNDERISSRLCKRGVQPHLERDCLR